MQAFAKSSTIHDADLAKKIQEQLDTNMFGPLLMSQAFAPCLAANGGGAIVNILSVLSWLSLPTSASYSISKAAAWALTNSLRTELKAQGTLVLAAHMGFMDTEMSKNIPAQKASPATVAELIVSALARGEQEVLCDELSQKVREGLSEPSQVFRSDSN